jgi:hypothetical protein
MLMGSLTPIETHHCHLTRHSGRRIKDALGGQTYLSIIKIETILNGIWMKAFIEWGEEEKRLKAFLWG